MLQNDGVVSGEVKVQVGSESDHFRKNRVGRSGKMGVM